MPTDVPRALASLARVFRLERVRWYVFGAQAVVAAGIPRVTSDIDVTLAIPRAQVPRLVTQLRAEFRLREIGDVESFITQTRVIPIVHRKTQLPIDLVLAGPGLEEEMLERAQLHPVGRSKIPFIEINDLLVLKVLAGRPKDLEDVRALLLARPPGLRVATVRARIKNLAALLDDSTLPRLWDELTRRSKKRR